MRSSMFRRNLTGFGSVLGVLIFLVACGFKTNEARAEVYVFEVDSSNSSLSLDGFAEVVLFGIFPFGEQASGSLTTSYSGTITVDLDDFNNPTSIEFQSADIVAAVNGQWQPNDAGNGLAPSGDGNYGVSTSFGVGKLRGLSFNLGSTAPAAISSGQFSSSTQVWSHQTGNFDIFSPLLGDGNSQPLTAIAGDDEVNIAGNALISVVGSVATLTLPVDVTIGWGIPGSPDVFGEYIYSGTIVATAILGSPPAEVVDASVVHVGWSGGGSATDSGKSLLKEGVTPQEATYDNLINTSLGINGVEFAIQDLGNGGALSASDFEFQVSPPGTFDINSNPPTSWDAAPSPTAVGVTPGSPDQVLITWTNNDIANRWLRITLKANANTGLAEPEVYYVGHLRGETTGPDGNGVYTVSFSDVTPIRSANGQTVGSESVVDIDKNGTVSFGDISAMLGNVGSQLSNITVPVNPPVK